jgi:PAS domain S-box-containing protein
MEGDRRAGERENRAMKEPGETRRVIWLVRLLTAVGLATIIVLIGLVGHQIKAIHTERDKLRRDQATLEEMSREILRRSSEARSEIIAILDDSVRSEKSGAAASLAEMVRSMIGSSHNPFGPAALKELDTLTERLASIERRALVWRMGYDPIWRDVQQQLSMVEVRDLVTSVRGAVETLEGGQQLREAIQFRLWKAASGEEAARLARNILVEQEKKQSRDTGDVQRELAEVESLILQLNGEEQDDNLPNLKDNELTPAIQRLRHDIEQLVEAQPDNVATTAAIERLTEMLFGRGYTMDEVHQTILIGAGGLYALRRNILALRRERANLDAERSTVSHEIDVVVAAFIQAARAQADLLTGQVEQNLDSSWRRMMITGLFCSSLFVLLAWFISRGIQGQFSLIEAANSEAESGRQKSFLLMQNLDKLQRDNALVLNAIGEGIHWINLAGQIIFENPASTRMLGWEFSEIKGRPAHATIHHTRADGGGYPQAECPIYVTLRTGMSQRVANEVFWRKDGTSFPVEYMTAPIRDENDKIVGAAVVFSDITERKGAETELAKLHQKLIETSRRAGMAEVATGVLHNVGNVLNSVNVSATLVSDYVSRSKSANVAKLAALFEEHRADLSSFLTLDPRGQMIPEYLWTLKDLLADERTKVTTEIEYLRKNVEHIKDIIAMQQSYAKSSGFTEKVLLSELVEDALRMNAASLAQKDVELVRDFQIHPIINSDRHKIVQILVNLVRNAKFACDEANRLGKQITIRITGDVRSVRVSVIDNGVGISVKSLARIFEHGFTTRKNGHGFGLHSGAIAAKELGGSITVQSAGPDCGATFILELPYKSDTAAHEDSIH